MPTEITTLVQFFKVLADSTRLHIVGLLAVEERSVEDIATLVDVRAPTVSHHLSKLKKLGLVTVRSEGTTRWYRLDLKNLERLARETLASETFTDIGELSLRESVELLNASISYESPGERYRVSLYGTNLTDEIYVNSRTIVPPLFDYRNVSPPRQWGVEFGWNL